MVGNPQRLLIRGGQVYDHDGDAHKPALADILIEGGNIVAVGRDLPSEGVQAILDAPRPADRARPDQRALLFARYPVPRHVRGAAAGNVAALHAADRCQSQQGGAHVAVAARIPLPTAIVVVSKACEQPGIPCLGLRIPCHFAE